MAAGNGANRGKHIGLDTLERRLYASGAIHFVIIRSTPRATSNKGKKKKEEK
jgi:hypothetical protein